MENGSEAPSRCLYDLTLGPRGYLPSPFPQAKLHLGTSGVRGMLGGGRETIPVAVGNRKQWGDVVRLES